MKIKGILVDVYNEKSEILEVEDTLDEYYRLLDCRVIDIVSRVIGARGHRISVDIVCDDEGLSHNPQKISAGWEHRNSRRDIRC